MRAPEGKISGWGGISEWALFRNLPNPSRFVFLHTHALRLLDLRLTDLVWQTLFVGGRKTSSSPNYNKSSFHSSPENRSRIRSTRRSTSALALTSALWVWVCDLLPICRFDIWHSSCRQVTYAEYYIRVHRHRHRTYRFVLCCLRTLWFVPSRKPWKGRVHPHYDSL
jgi:hypothetical protein